MATIVKAPTRFKVTKLSGSLGAEIAGLDLARPIDPETMAELRQAFLDHLVLVFPGQGHITPAQQVAFCQNWGEVHYMAGGGGIEGGAVFPITTSGRQQLKELAKQHSSIKGAKTDQWHYDVSYEEAPPLGSFLLAREIPSAGGDTMWANQYLAYETLSDKMQAFVDGLEALHSGYGFWVMRGLDPALAPEAVHPVVRTHPETGKRGLFVHSVWTKCIVGLSERESETLLSYLYEHSSQPNFTFRHRWRQGDLVMWDNRCTQHFAIDDYGEETRIMHRTTIVGDKPFRR